MVDGACATLSKLSLQNDRVTPGEELKDSEVVTTDERYEGVSFSGGSFPEHSESANGHRPAPPLYSEVCPSLDLPSTEDAGPSKVPIPSPPPISSPPPYTLLPEELPQQLSSSSTAEHEQTLCDFQCAACKFKTKFTLPVGKRVGLVRCSKCKECTPLVPPHDGKVHGRCAFCKCLILYSPTAKAIVCPRETCKKLLFASTTSGKMMRRVPCEVCGYVMRIIKDPHDLVSSNIHVCSQCGEKNPIGPAPPGKMYTRCPYCNVLLQHKNGFSGRVQCPKVTCKKMVEVGDGEKLSVECSTCKKNIVYYGDKKVVLCGHCGNTSFVGKPPAGKIYIRCKNCSILLIVDKGATAAKCPIKTCGKVMVVSSN
jgi:DNA-directed RNA polymerase subunit RPC12/RpoP